MALRRTMNDNSARGWQCLKCGMPFSWDQKRRQGKGNDIYTCPNCGQGHYVDRMQSHRTTITVAERPELRPAMGTGKDGLTAPCAIIDEFVVQRHEEDEENVIILRKELLKARLDAEAWKNAAEGLAREVEILKEKERQAEKVAVKEREIRQQA